MTVSLIEQWIQGAGQGSRILLPDVFLTDRNRHPRMHPVLLTGFDIQRVVRITPIPISPIHYRDKRGAMG